MAKKRKVTQTMEDLISFVMRNQHVEGCNWKLVKKALKKDFIRYFNRERTLTDPRWVTGPNGRALLMKRFKKDLAALKGYIDSQV